MNVTGAEGETRFGILGILDRGLQVLENVAAIVGGLMMLSAMVLTMADALMRYWFNNPLLLVPKLTESYLMVGMMTMPLAWGFRTGGYIRITGFVDMFPQPTRRLILRVGLLASCAYVAALTWMSWGYFIGAWRRGEVQMGVIDWPVAWQWIWVPVGLALLGLRLLFSAIGPASRLHVEHDEVT